MASTLLFGFVEGDIVGRLMLGIRSTTFSSASAVTSGTWSFPSIASGYAVEMLRQGLDIARSMALERVLLTCDEDNVASLRVIEKSGGEYEDSYVAPEAAIGKRRYWISLSKP